MVWNIFKIDTPYLILDVFYDSKYRNEKVCFGAIFIMSTSRLLHDSKLPKVKLKPEKIFGYKTQ